MEGALLLIMALGGLTAFGVGVVLLILYWRSGRRGYGEPMIYGNLVQCPRCQYMNPLDSAACLNCQLPLSHQRHPYQPPPSPTYPTLPPQIVSHPAPSPNAPAQYAPLDQTVAQSRTPVSPPPSPQRTDPRHTPPDSRDPALPPARKHALQDQQAQSSSNNPPPEGMPAAWLEGERGVVAGQRTMLVQSDTLFGRSTQCDVQIYDPKVSRQHFVIRYGNGAFFLQDQGSSRGTLINGEPVKARRLQDGDRIELGDTSLVFHVET